jgi:hypothetical protein
MAVAPEGTAPPAFVWGGRSWSTGDLPVFKKWLAAHGLNYAQWAANHADTARSVFGGIGSSLPGAPANGPGSGSSPVDYASQIEGDPVYQSIKNSLSAQGVADAAGRAAAIRRLLVQFGQSPDVNSVANKLGLSSNDLAMLRGDITPDIQHLAQQNTDEGTSVVAQLDRAAKNSEDSLMNQLGASGLFHSGATGYQLGQHALAKKTAYSEALQRLLDAFGGTIGAFNSSERGRQQQIAAALSEAAARQQAARGSTVNPGGPNVPAGPPAGPLAGPPAPPPVTSPIAGYPVPHAVSSALTAAAVPHVVNTTHPLVQHIVNHLLSPNHLGLHGSWGD